MNPGVLVRMKAHFGEKRLVIRIMGSTVVGEFADTLIFRAIAAPVIGISDPGTFTNYVVVQEAQDALAGPGAGTTLSLWNSSLRPA